MTRARVLVPLLLIAGACTTDSPTAPADPRPNASLQAVATVSVVMRNLNSPRGLAWGLDGGLYVAEAGTTAIMSLRTDCTRCELLQRDRIHFAAAPWRPGAGGIQPAVRLQRGHQ